MDSSTRVLELVGKKHTSGLAKADKILAINCMLEQLAGLLRYKTAPELGNESLRCYLYTDGRHSLKKLREELEASRSRSNIPFRSHEKKLMSSRGFFSRHFTPQRGLPDGKEFVSAKFCFDRDCKWHAYKIMLRLTENSLTGPTTPTSIIEEKGDVLDTLTDPEGEYSSLGIRLDDFRSLVVDTAESLRERAADFHQRTVDVDNEIKTLDMLVQHLMA